MSRQNPSGAGGPLSHCVFPGFGSLLSLFSAQFPSPTLCPKFHCTQPLVATQAAQQSPAVWAVRFLSWAWKEWTQTPRATLAAAQKEQTFGAPQLV